MASREFADRVAAIDPRVRVTANPGPHGQAANINHAMSLARGEWIKPLHDDDELDDQPPPIAGIGQRAEATELPLPELKAMAARLVNEVPGLNRVVFDLTSKPPGTIEWE